MSIYATPARAAGPRRSGHGARDRARGRAVPAAAALADASSIGAIVILFWVFCAMFPRLVAPYDPDLRQQLPDEPAADLGSPVRHRHERPRRLLARARRLTRLLLIAPAATLLGIVLGTMLGLITGYLRGVVDDVVSRFIDAVLSLPLIVTAILDRHRRRQVVDVA